MNDDLKYLDDKKFFDVNGFLIYLHNKFPETNNDYVNRIILNIMNEAATDFNYDDMEFITRIAIMLPQISIDDIKKFANEWMIKTK